MPANAAAAGPHVASAFTTASYTFSTVGGFLPAVQVAAAAIALLLASEPCKTCHIVCFS